MTDDAGALLAEHNKVNYGSQLCRKLLNLWLRGMASESDKLRKINCRIQTYTPMTCTQTHRILGKLLYLGLKHIQTDPCCIRPVECFEWKQLWVQLNVNVLLTAKYSWVVKKSFRTAVTTGIRIHNLQSNAHYREFEVMTKNFKENKPCFSCLTYNKTQQETHYGLNSNVKAVGILACWTLLFFSSKWSAVFKKAVHTLSI